MALRDIFRRFLSAVPTAESPTIDKIREVREGIIAGPGVEDRGYELLHDSREEDPELPREDKEYGASGTEVFQGKVQQREYNPDWMGPKIRKSDGSARSVIQSIKLPLRRAQWRVSPSEEDGGDEKAKEIAAFCHSNLIGTDDMHENWDTVLRHVLLMLDFGFSVIEKVWKVNDKGQYVLARLAPRLPWTIKDFEVNRDGSLKTVHQEVPGENKTRKIPAKYACVFTYEKEGDDFWGTSMLRFLYQHWFYKTEMYRIDAVRLDRFGIGIPLGYIKEGYVLKPQERREVINLLKGLRSHERAFALLPEEIQIKIMTPENERGGASGLMESVDHHDVMMARSVLALFLTAGSQKHGNYGTTVTWQDLFLYSLQSLALQISQDMQRQIVRDLCDYNFDMTGRQYPKMEASTLEDTNVKELAASLYNLVLGQVIVPDDELEKHIRRIMGFPLKEEGYGREELGLKGALGGNPALAAPNITGEASPDDKEAINKLEPTKGTKASTTPQLSGPIRVPGELK
jgi:hypothetical protein